jgi:hypothetical protein
MLRHIFQEEKIMSFKERLASMGQQVDEANSDYSPGGNFAPIPDDDYLAKVKCTLDETKKAPARLQVTWIFVIAEGELEGRQVYDRTIIEDNKVGMQICRQRVEELGYQWPEPDQFENLEAIVENITERAPSITIRTKTSQSETNGKKYDNTRVYIREVHEVPEQTEEESQGEETAESDKTEDQETPVGNDPETLHAALLDFCASQGLDGVSEDMGTKEIIDGMVEGQLTFLGPTLTQEEVDMLTAAGGAGMIQWKTAAVKKPVATTRDVNQAIKKQVAKATPAPAPVKKAVLVKKGKK